MAKSRASLELWGKTCYFCGQSLYTGVGWYPYGGKHKVKTKRNTMVYFHEECYRKNLEESRRNEDNHD